LAWQDGDAILLQRFGRDCKSQSGVMDVYRTRDFFKLADSGLWDIAGLGDGRLVVAWILGTDVWVRVVDETSSGGDAQPVRANNASKIHPRTEVRVYADPDTHGFVVAWSSWEQDGDGWGIFARRFTEAQVASWSPLDDEEKQVNSRWRDFQWQPQLAWCGHVLWALWTNSSGFAGTCASGPGGCSTGPLLRRIAVYGGNNTWDMGPEINVPQRYHLDDSDQMAAALACGKNGTASVMWLVKSGEQVEQEDLDPDLHLAHDNDSPDALANVSERRLQQRAESTNLGTRMQLQRRSAGHRPTDTAGMRGNRLSSGHDDPLGLAAASMIASNGIMAVLTNDGQGTFSAQLLDYGRMQSARVYPQREIGGSAHDVRSAWDAPAGGGTSPYGDPDEAIVMCWLSGNAEAGGRSSFVCSRRKLSWLMGSGPLEFGATLMAIVLLVSIVSFMCLRHCSRNRLRLGFFPGRLQLRGLRRMGRRSQRPRASSREDMREQLVNISMVDVSGRAETASDVTPADADAPTAEPVRGSVVVDDTAGDGASCCAICQCEVQVRIALQNCGHTACRDCVIRLVEMNQRCHICRGPIEGVIPVYM
jgi:hypothetical protein